MSKWRVERERHAYTGELMPGWVVKKQEDGFLPTFKTWWKGTTWETWQEALTYADKLARTREVVLPRDTARPSEHLEIGPMYWGGAVVTTVDDGARLLLSPKEIRPLALALLAHAERMSE